MKVRHPTREEQLARLAAMKDEDIDFSDAPEIEDWSGAVRGPYYEAGKQIVAFPLNTELVEWLDRQEGGASAALERLVREAARRAA